MTTKNTRKKNTKKKYVTFSEFITFKTIKFIFREKFMHDKQKKPK